MTEVQLSEIKSSKNILMRFIALLLTLVINFSCLPDEDKFIGDKTQYVGLTCYRNNLPQGFQCLWDDQFETDDLVRFDLSGIYGTWYSSSLDRCVVFDPDGTGLITQSAGAEPLPIYWGAMVDSHGNNVNGNSPVWRIKIMGENYTTVNPKYAQYHEDLDLFGNYGYQHVSSCGVDDFNNEYGTVSLWTQYSNLLPIQVTIAGETKTINQTFTPDFVGDVPECSSGLCATFYLPEGDYIIQATSNQENWYVYDTLHITAGYCNRSYFE